MGFTNCHTHDTLLNKHVPVAMHEGFEQPFTMVNKVNKVSYYHIHHVKHQVNQLIETIQIHYQRESLSENVYEANRRASHYWKTHV